MNYISNTIINQNKIIILLFFMMESLLFSQQLPHNLSQDEKNRLNEIVEK